MSSNIFRSAVAITVLGGHIVSFGLLIYCTQQGGFLRTQGESVATILSPFFVFYLTAVLKNTATEWKQGRSSALKLKRKVSGLFPPTALIICIIGSLALPVLIWQKAHNYISNFDTFRWYLAVLETAFSAAMGLIVNEIFPAAGDAKAEGAKGAEQKKSARMVRGAKS